MKNMWIASADEMAAISFERSASFMAMMELEMEEVCIER
jgi:hypothetical protein